MNKLRRENFKSQQDINKITIRKAFLFTAVSDSYIKIHFFDFVYACVHTPTPTPTAINSIFEEQQA